MKVGNTDSTASLQELGRGTARQGLVIMCTAVHKAGYEVRSRLPHAGTHPQPKGGQATAQRGRSHLLMNRERPSVTYWSTMKSPLQGQGERRGCGRGAAAPRNL